MRALHLFLTMLCTLMYGVIMFALFAVHVATTFFVYQIAGIWPAIITFFTPPFAELWWALSTWWDTGNFLNLFTEMILGVVALYAVQVVLAFLMAVTEPKEPA